MRIALNYGFWEAKLVIMNTAIKQIGSFVSFSVKLVEGIHSSCNQIMQEATPS